MGEDRNDYVKPPRLSEDVIRVAEEYRRRKVTSVLAIMFTDIEGSTDLREELGELTYERYREEHDGLVRDLVASENAGVVVKSTGDGALAVFAEPSSAVVKGLEIQAALSSHRYFKLRVGIDMGQVSMTSQGGIVADVFGRQVNRAARIQSLTQPQHVLTSFHVYDCAVGWLAGTSIKWHNHGTAKLKGFSESVSVHEPYDPQRMNPQQLELSGQHITSGGEKIVQLGPAYSSFRVRPIDRVPGADPFDFYEKAISLTVARLLQIAPSVPVILWVDDFPDNNVRESEMLAASGCRVDLALSTSEAITRLSSRQYTLVISDMGRGDNPTAGLELLDWMRKQNLQLPTLLYCSSRAVSLYGGDATRRGALLCTFGLISLLDAILQVLEQSWYFT